MKGKCKEDEGICKENERKWKDYERKTEKQPEHLVMMDIARKIILASCKLLLYNTTIEPATQSHTASKNEEGDQKVPEGMEQIEEEEEYHLHSAQ